MGEGTREALQEANWALFNLCINLGLIESVIDQYPPHVQEGFAEKLAMTRDWAEKMMEEAQAFGEAYDDDTEEAQDEE